MYETIFPLPKRLQILIIFAFSYLGSWLDEKYKNSSEIYFKVLTLLGVFVAIFQVIRQVNQINKNK